MINLFKRRKVTFLDKEWNVIKTDVKVSAIPRVDELIYDTDEGKYYEVIKVIYNLTNKKCQDIFVIIELYSGNLKINEEKA